MKFTESFHLFQKEGILTRSCLLSGLTSLRKANIDDVNQGLFYQAFFELSIGLERLMKLIVVIDHMVKNDLTPMTDRELKNNYGHKLLSLYQSCENLFKEHNLESGEFYGKKTIEYEILSFLGEFAQSSRYYNLSKLSDSNRTSDPLSEWWEIENKLIRSELKESKIEKYRTEALKLSDSLGGNHHTLLTGMKGEMLTMAEAMFYPRLAEAVSPHIVWKVFRVLRPLYSLVYHVSGLIHELDHKKGNNTPTVPYMHEFFPFLLADKPTVLRRKKWS